MAEYLGIQVDYSRDSLISEFGLLTLKEGYMLPHETSPQQAFARAAVAFCGFELSLAQRIYDYASKQWFCFSTPILSNGGTKRGMPVSCFLSYVGDSRQGLNDHWSENTWLSSEGGGIAGCWSGVRADGCKTSNGGKSTGTIPFMKVVDSQILSTSQGTTRRGAYAAYQDISHPEIEEFVIMRKPTGGDYNRKCLNLHHGVNISDKFMEAVKNGLPWDLVDPHSKQIVKTVDARALWATILETRVETGEPYLHFIDTTNEARHACHKESGLDIKQSNLCCVTGDTVILTDKGHLPIADLSGTSTEVWNGEEWSTVDVVKTNDHAEVVKVSLSSGQTIECTLYHKFHTVPNYGKTLVKVASQLEVGDKLVKFSLPIIEGSEVLPKSYTNGFYSGDGCCVSDKEHRVYGHVDGLRDKFFVPSATYTIESRLKWLAGLSDSDGTIARNGSNESLQIGSINKQFLLEIQLMLQTLGVNSKVVSAREEGQYALPLNDGTGGCGLYNCKEVSRLLVSSTGLHKLFSLGFTCNRLKFSGRKPQRNAEQFSRVIKVERTGKFSSTYCFNEPRKHVGIFNGVLTGQSEIVLPTNEERTAVCVLSSVNLEKWEEWKNTTLVQDLTKFLDNVLQYFVDNAPDTMGKAKFSASQERSIGIGTMGFYSLLQSKSIPFESALAESLNRTVFDHIKFQAELATSKLAEVRGNAPDCPEYIDNRRNVYLIAIAPNASSSIIVGTSPSIEPIAANAYTHKTKVGSHLVKNKYLAALLTKRCIEKKEELGYTDLDETLANLWSSIIEHGGSVSHLDMLTDWEKDVFKTAFEIDQRWVIHHASVRQQFIDQAQSVNLFVPSDIGKAELHELHFSAWEKGLKTLYYLRSKAIRQADKLNKKIKRERLDEDTPNRDTGECLSCQ